MDEVMDKKLKKKLTNIILAAMKYLKRYQKQEDQAIQFANKKRKFGFLFVFNNLTKEYNPILFYPGEINLIDQKYVPFPILVTHLDWPLNILASKNIINNKGYLKYTNNFMVDVQEFRSVIDDIETLSFYNDNNSSISFKFNNTCQLNMESTKELKFHPINLLNIVNIKGVIKKILLNTPDIIINSKEIKGFYNQFNIKDSGGFGEIKINNRIIIYKSFIPNCPMALNIYYDIYRSEEETIISIGLDQIFKNNIRTYVFYRYIHI